MNNILTVYSVFITILCLSTLKALWVRRKVQKKILEHNEKLLAVNTVLIKEIKILKEKNET